MTFRLRHLALLATALLAGCQWSSPGQSGSRHHDVRLETDATTVEGLVPPNATLESLLRQQQVPPDLTESMVDAIRAVFNPRRLRADQTYWVTRTFDGIFREFRYQIDADNLLQVVFHKEAAEPASPFDVKVVPLPKDYVLTAASAAITHEHNSLVGAFGAQGENIMLPLELADIFAGDLDFNSDLQLGDRVDVLFDRAERNGEFVGYGDVHAAIIETGGDQLTAFRYRDADGNASWYDIDGHSLRRQFLRSPLPFDPRVTSSFSYNRVNPVLGVRRPHLGVDFGAPVGTRVFATAAGVVESAGWAGQAGRMVRLRHTGGYETEYLHLSGFGAGIRRGVRVAQGQVIGYVGQTGLATGPHLDYRVIKNGTHLNPLTAFRRMPAGKPVPAGAQADFRRVRDLALNELQTRLGTSDANAASDTDVSEVP